MDVEGVIGIRGYGTSSPGVGGVLKSTPDDFVVEEIAEGPPPSEGGRYTVARIRSRNWETNRLVREMSRRLRVSRKRISFAGTKDKRAVTTQRFQFELPEERLRHLRLRDVDVLDAYATDRKLEIGDLLGNRFRIVARDLSLPPEEAASALDATAAQLSGAGGFPSFFGIQRFGSIRPITHIVGRHIVRGEFREAVNAYVANPVEGEDPETHAARRALAETEDYAAALEAFPDVMGFEKAILNRLARDPQDFVTALEALPFNLLMMFVHGYQSYMFNRVLSERLARGIPWNEPVVGDLVLPAGPNGLPDEGSAVPVREGNLGKARRQVRDGKAFVSGPLFGSEGVLAGGVVGELEREVVDAESLRPQDFIVPRMPRLSSKGTRRALHTPVRGLDARIDGDAAVLSFELPKGCYATSLLREFMK